ncbi:STAS domain-containing protein [Mycobacteroides salmoniphilum]|uniref:STAS domain-containing protein n=1 Tax=Mycobacteroides salmoniphilum TaxID=404941 RepID=UPI001064E2C0|nr:STAS domain-containing protein [Mycobacteroides salmoniphilum]TDZ89864.1 hypothetical protein CCUG62472_04804 [Mycobacteroides salmoniphilum]
MSIQAFSPPRPPLAEMPYSGPGFQFTATTRYNAVTVAATGELDATNADCFVYYVLRHLRGQRALVLDLRNLDFCGSEGFLAVLKVRCYCKHHGVGWSLLPGEAVDRILEIGDPDGWTPTAAFPNDDLETSAPRISVI